MPCRHRPTPDTARNRLTTPRHCSYTILLTFRVCRVRSGNGPVRQKLFHHRLPEMSEAQAPPWTSRQAGRQRPQAHADWSRPMPQANQVLRRRAPGLQLQYRTSEAVRTTYLYRGNKTARHLFGICRFQCARTMDFRCRMPVSMPMRLSMSIFSYILFKCYLSLFRTDKHNFSGLPPISETVQS